MSDCAAGTRTAYDTLAPFYDELTAHHDYDTWTADLEALARRHGLTGSRLLDIGCGTGKSFMPFRARGWTVTGCDLSPRMIGIACSKAPEVALEVCDMRALPALGSFDLVCCIDDGVNYLTEQDDLVAAFAGIRRNLARGGLALFDVNTLATYRGFFATCSVTSSDDRVLVWQGLTPIDAPSGVLAQATMTAFVRVGAASWTRTASLHRQRHHPPASVREALTRAGLELVAMYGQGLDGTPVEPLDELCHTKAVFLARAGASPIEREEVFP